MEVISKLFDGQGNPLPGGPSKQGPSSYFTGAAHCTAFRRMRRTSSRKKSL
jgi:hypothetical protein